MVQIESNIKFLGPVFCNTPKQKTQEQSPKVSEGAGEESHKDLSDTNAEDFMNHRRTLRNDFVAPRVVEMSAKTNTLKDKERGKEVSRG